MSADAILDILNDYRANRAGLEEVLERIVEIGYFPSLSFSTDGKWALGLDPIEVMDIDDEPDNMRVVSSIIPAEHFTDSIYDATIKSMKAICNGKK